MAWLDALIPDPDRAAIWMLVLARLSGALALTPMLAGIPLSVRAGVAAVLSVALADGLPAARPALQFTALLSEFALGATLGLGIQLVFMAFAVGGRLLDVQIGYGIGQVLDPLTRTQLPLLSAAFNQLAVVLFVLMDGLQGVLRGLALSLESIPPGQAWPLEKSAASLLLQLASQYSLGFAMVAPVVACLLLVEIGLGVVARSAPQMNIFLLGLPLKIVVGLLCLAAWLPAQLGLMGRAQVIALRGWEAVFR